MAFHRLSPEDDTSNPLTIPERNRVIYVACSFNQVWLDWDCILGTGQVILKTILGHWTEFRGIGSIHSNSKYCCYIYYVSSFLQLLSRFFFVFGVQQFYYLRVIFFTFIQFGVQWILESVNLWFWSNFEKCSAITYSKITFCTNPFFCSLWAFNDMNIRPFDIVPEILEALFNFFSFCSWYNFF